MQPQPLAATMTTYIVGDGRHRRGDENQHVMQVALRTFLWLEPPRCRSVTVQGRDGCEGVAITATPFISSPCRIADFALLETRALLLPPTSEWLWQWPSDLES